MSSMSSSLPDETTHLLHDSSPTRIQGYVNETNVDGKTDTEAEKGEKKDTPFSFRALDKRKKTIILMMGFVNLCACMCFSLLAPFFPAEAKKKGASESVTGFIFSVFELTIFLSAPVFGNFLTRIGAKFMFVSGILVCGTCAILFGTLDQSPPGQTFIIMCFSCRLIEALGASGFVTASFAIVSNEFPEHVATVFGSLETFSGIGMMIGPTVGGGLYQAGGYGLPFWVLGSILIICGLVTAMLLPRQEECNRKQSGSILTLLKSGRVWLTAFSCVCGSFALGFLDPTLAPHLEKFKLQVAIVGLVFLVAPGLYGFTAPLWGYVGDKMGYVLPFMVIGNLLSAVSFLLMGPTPLLSFLPFELWIIILSLGLMGIFVGCALIPCFKSFIIGAKDLGMEDNLNTYGLVSGLFNSCFSLGAFIGPTAAGVMLEHLGFAWAATVCSGLFLLAMALMLIYSVCTWLLKKRSSREVYKYSSLQGHSDQNDAVA